MVARRLRGVCLDLLAANELWENLSVRTRASVQLKCIDVKLFVGCVGVFSRGLPRKSKEFPKSNSSYMGNLNEYVYPSTVAALASVITFSFKASSKALVNEGSMHRLELSSQNAHGGC